MRYAICSLCDEIERVSDNCSNIAHYHGCDFYACMLVLTRKEAKRLKGRHKKVIKENDSYGGTD